jgi:hypothetical protein
VPARLDARRRRTRLHINRAPLDAKREQQAVSIKRQMRTRVEEAASLQLFGRERRLHPAHHATVRATREIDDACASRRLAVNSAPREIVETFRLIFDATCRQKSLADRADPTLRERF